MNARPGEDILAYLEGRRPEMVAFLEQLVRAESPTRVPEAQANVQGLLTKALVDLGYVVRLIAGEGRSGGHLYARPGDRVRRRPAQLLVGHCDTVWPLGTLAGMPFEVRGHAIKGPGTNDMKGGLTQLVFALEALRDLGLPLVVTPVVFINSDEEIGSPESKPLIRMLARRACRAFVLEPALGLSGKLKTARKGAGSFVVRVAGRAPMPGSIPKRGPAPSSSWPTSSRSSTP